MREFTLQGSEGALKLSGDPPGSQEPYGAWCYTAELNSKSLTATVKVYDHLPQRFREFFGQIAQDWRGWSGAREYESLEPMLKISATHNNIGRISFEGSLSAGAETMFDWTASQVLTVDPGAADSIAANAAEFAAV